MAGLTDIECYAQFSISDNSASLSLNSVNVSECVALLALGVSLTLVYVLNAHAGPVQLYDSCLTAAMPTRSLTAFSTQAAVNK